LNISAISLNIGAISPLKERRDTDRNIAQQTSGYIQNDAEADFNA